MVWVDVFTWVSAALVASVAVRIIYVTHRGEKAEMFSNALLGIPSKEEQIRRMREETKIMIDTSRLSIDALLAEMSITRPGGIIRMQGNMQHLKKLFSAAGCRLETLPSKATPELTWVPGPSSKPEVFPMIGHEE